MVDVRNPAFRAMFREYDLRGRVADGELTEDSVRLIANAFGRLLQARDIDRVVVGYDNRPASPGFSRLTPPSPACWPPAWRWWTSA